MIAVLWPSPPLPPVYYASHVAVALPKCRRIRQRHADAVGSAHQHQARHLACQRRQRPSEISLQVFDSNMHSLDQPR